MVFESVLVDILNRFLGPYIKNLDASQLQVSVWSGNIKLDNLELKENALEQFNIPVRVHFGFLDKFRAKIPWKNLYNEPTIVEIDGLYVIAGPNSAFKFDPAKALEEARNKKLEELEKFKRIRKNKKQKKEKQEETQDQTFAEKVVTQVIKNLQVTIKNIHIRYEDTHTIPGQMFAAGISLSQLIMHSVDGNWKLGANSSDPASRLIYKLFDLQCLALYWNVQSESYYRRYKKKEDLLKILRSDIADTAKHPTHLQFILMPVSANAKVQLDTKGGQDLTTPQALVNLQVEELNLSMSTQQYRQALSLLEEFDRLGRNKPYAKFRPEVELKTHPKEWWNYAYNSVLSEIQPKLQEFSWEHIKHHRELCRRYIAKYQKKLLSTTSNPERSKTLALLEQELDVFNILLCREIAEERAAKQKKLKKEQSKSTWSSWLGWGKSKSKSQDDDVIIGDINLGSAGQLDEEKKKFYSAIGYTEGNLPNKVSAYPKEYVALQLHFVMKKLIVNLRDENDGIAKLATDTFKADATYRPSVKGLAFHTEFSHVVINGCRRGTSRPIILQDTRPKQALQIQEGNGPLFALDFEMNPLNSKLDFKIGACLQPIEVVYDAKTIDSIIGMFIIPPEIHLFDLRKAALATVEDIRTMSRSGLQFAIQNRTLLEIKVDIQAPYIIVPEKGEYSPDQHSMLILDLGSLHIFSDTQDVLSLDINLATQEQLESAFYDKFNLRLENLQALVASPGQDWMSARERKDDLKLHVIKPTGFELAVSKSLIPNDTRLPNLRVNGTINALNFTLSDKKIQTLTEIVLSLPLPPPSIVNHATQVAKMGTVNVATNPPTKSEFDNLFDNLNFKSADKIFILTEDDSEDTSSEFYDVASLDSADTASFTTSTSSDPSEVVDQSQLPTYIKLLADITIERIGILITKEEQDREIPQLLLELSNGVIHLKQRTWDLILNSELGELKMLDLTTIKPGTDNESLALLTSETENKVFSLQLCIAERQSPEYHTLFNSTHKTVRVTTYPMHFSLDKNSLFNVTTLLVSLLPSVEKTKNSPLVIQGISSVDQIDEAVEGKLGYKPTFWGRENEKGLHLDLTMHPATLTLYDYTGPFIRAEFLGIQASITLQRLRMDMELTIQGYLISNLNPKTFYPILLNKVDPNVPFLKLKLNVFKEATLKDKYLDLEQKDVSIEVKLARIRLVLLAPLIAKVVPFFTQLARIDFSQKALIDTAKDTATVTAKETAEAAKNQSSSRIAVNLIIEAPSILIPLDSSSRDVFIIDVGNFDALNSFHFASELYGSPEDSEDKWINCHGLHTVVDKMKVTFSDLQINRSKSYFIPEINSADTNQKFPILQPVNFILFLNRALTDCNTEIPKNQLTVKIDTISIHIKPQDLVNLSSVVTSLRLVQAALEIAEARQQVNSSISQESPKVKSQPSKVLSKETSPTSKNAIVISAILDTVKITIYSEEDSFADLFLTHLSIDAEIIPPVSKLRAVIRSFGIRDLSPNSIYPEILTSSAALSNNFVNLELESYQNATKGDKFFDPSQADGKISLTIGKIKCYLIYTFINHILHTLLQFTVSRKAVNAFKKQAKKQAASTATSTVEKISQNETKRMLLAVKIEAPVIVVPVSAESSEGLVIDLGLITVNNGFSHEKPRFCQSKDFDFPLELSHKLMFDKIDFSISSIQLYRQISQDLSIKKCDPILQSFELNLSIIRTIPFDSNDKSQVMIYVSLSPIFMEFHLNDYKTILCIIQSNFKSSKVLQIPVDNSDVDDSPEETEEEPDEMPQSSKKISLPYLTLILHLDGYTLSIIARDEEISKLVFKTLDVELRSTEQKLTFSGELGEFLLTQPCNATLYSKIISLPPESQQVMRFNLTYVPNLAHNPALPSYNSEYDIDINLEVGEIEVVVLYSYISKIVNFATKFSPKRSANFEPETPKEEAIPPDERLLGTIASLDRLIKVKKRAKVNVNFKAPRIYIPQSSNSNQVIIIDLGKITLKSEPTIKKISDTNEEILNDNYQLNLVHLAISRAFINVNEKNDIESPNAIRPLTSRFCLELSLIRRITRSINSPFLLFNMHLHEVSLLLASLDLEMISNLITDQIKEQDTTLSENDSDFSFSLPISPITKSNVELSPKQPPMSKRRETVSKPHVFKSDPNTPLLSVHFKIDSIGLKLFHKEKDISQNMRQLVEELNIFNIPEEKGLANLAIVGISLNAQVRPNLVAEFDLVLNDIVVQDARTEKASTINRMLSRSILSKSQNPLLAVTLERISSDDLTLQIYLSELTIIFSTEFLITLGLFFWNPIEKVIAVQGSLDPKPRRKDKKKDIAPANSAQEVSDFIPTFRIVLAVKNPTIFLLENTDTANPHALVGKLELSGIIKHDRGIGFSTTFTLSQAMLYNCQYQTFEKPYSHVIAPFDVHMTMKAHPENVDVSIAIESISVNLTPSTLALISNIAASLKFPDQNNLGYAPTDLWAEHKTPKYSWFLRSSESIDSWSVVVEGTAKSESQNLKVEKIDLEIQNLDFKLDSDFKGKITPVLLFHSYIEAQLQNWSTQLELESLITTEASYFNEKLSTWEPLLEPSKSRNSDNLVPLRLKIYLNKSEKGSSSDVVLLSDSETQTQALQAEYALEVTAIDGINLTVSREMIELLSKFKDEFDIVKSSVLSWNTDISHDIPLNSVYSIQNELGIPINIALDEKDIFVFDPNALSKAKTIENNTPCHIYTTQPTIQMDQAILSKKGKVKNHYIHLSVESHNTIPFIPIHRTGNLLYFLPPRNDLFVVVEINLIQGRKQIIIRSPMKFRNEMDITLEIFYSPFNPRLTNPKSIGTIQPRETFYVPFHQAYNCKFYLAPSNLIYAPSTSDFSSESKFTTHFTECPVFMASSGTEEKESPFYFTLDSTEDVYTREPLRFQNDGNYPHHIFTAYFPSILHNLLPIPLSFQVENTGFKSDVQPGTTSTILFFRPDHPKDLIFNLKLFGFNFRGKFDRLNLNNSSTCKMHSTGNHITFVMGIYAEMAGSLQIKVFAPYWILNKSGVNLEYSSSESAFKDSLMHESNNIPFLFPSTSIGSQVKLAIRRSFSENVSTEWSKSIAIGAIGSENLAESRIPGTNDSFQFGIRITTSSLSFTKIVIITPYNLLINDTKQQISIEQETTEPIQLNPGDCLPFYPIGNLSKIFPDTSRNGSLLDITVPGQILLHFDGPNPAIAVDISTNVSSNVVTFQSYYTGAVPVQIVNSLSDVLIEVKQKGYTGVSTLVLPGTYLNYTWQDPSKPHEIEWWPSKQEKKKTIASVNFDADGKTKFAYGLDVSTITSSSNMQPLSNVTDSQVESFHEFDDISQEASMVMSNKSTSTPIAASLYWVSFMDGLQRILLITDDPIVAKHAKQVQKHENIKFSFSLNVEEISISLVDAITRTEIAYVTLLSSDTVWQYLKNGRIWKTLSGEIIKKLESAYKADSNSTLDQSDLKVDFQSMQLFEPYTGNLRRTHFPGVSLELQVSSSQLYFDIKIASVQVDNQMAHILYPIVFHSVALPTDALNFDPKPFVEASLILLLNKKMVKSLNIRYFKILVQEMSFNLDIGFVEGVIGLFGDLEQREWTTKELFELDYQKIINANITELEGSVTASQGSKHFIDYLHLSPLKINLSFSLQHGSEPVDKRLARKIVTTKAFRVLLDSLGVPGSAEKVLLQLKYLNIEHRSMTQRQIIQAFYKHYKQAGLTQIYKILLGLDVIGNPLALIREIGSGAKDLFYEPYQGAIEGPEAFIVGVGHGISSLAGSTVGGVAGAVSKITSTVGKGLAALSFDTRYQRSRRRQDIRARTAGEEFFRGGKSFATGLFEGVTGIVAQPVRGVAQEGAVGLVKGIGKGLIGVVARPLGGGIDLLTATFGSLQKAVSGDKVLVKKRHPRFIGEDKTITVFNLNSALGNFILNDIENGKYLRTVVYKGHLLLEDSKNIAIFIATNKKLIKAERKSFDPLNPWKDEDIYPLEEITDPIDLSDDSKKIILILHVTKQKTLFSSGKNRVLISTSDRKSAQVFANQFNQAFAEFNASY